MSAASKRFRVAFSFAGEKRDYVAKVSAMLAARFGEAAILYDKYHEAEFARRDLGFYLPDLYHKESDLVIVVVCRDYEKKEWCGLEWDAIFDLLKKRKNEEVMLCRFDHATVKGLYSTAGFVELDDKTADQATARILERLARNEGKSKDHYLSWPLEGRSPTAPRDFKAAASRLFRGRNQGADVLVGRDKELADLDAAWSGRADLGVRPDSTDAQHRVPTRSNIVIIVAWGGVGKTSLVSRWAADTLAKRNHSDIDCYFDWSFYSQGARPEGDATGAAKAASADLFIKEALEFFGDPDLAAGNAGAWQKGERLAQLIGQMRCLLILDGLEPLQDARTGELRDDGVRALLRGLAVHSHGLCVVTTRQHLPELAMWHQTTAPQWELASLTNEAGAALLTKLGVDGTDQEKRDLSARVKGHALTISLLGRYLKRCCHGDIRRADRVDFQKVNENEQGAHAFRVTAAYESWFKENNCRAELAILQMLGLFDRPATPDCLAALRDPPIDGLTDALASLSEDEWNEAVTHLVELNLAEEQPWERRRIVGYSKEAVQTSRLFGLGAPEQFETYDPSLTSRHSLDTHPLIREFFANRLQEASTVAWMSAHSRLFEHLRNSVPYWPEGLIGLQPLYQAVSHACQAGLYEEALVNVYNERIFRGGQQYPFAELAVYHTELSLAACFFEKLWTTPVSALSQRGRVFVLNQAATNLKALGRFAEAIEAASSAVTGARELEDKTQACMYANNLSELELALGEIATALRDSQTSVEIADAHQWWAARCVNRAGLGHALLCAGKMPEAHKHFREAEEIRAGARSDAPLLVSIGGVEYCDFLLANVERQAWRCFLSHCSQDDNPTPFIRDCLAVEDRARKTLLWIAQEKYGVGIALDNLTLGRAAFYRANFALTETDRIGALEAASAKLREAVSGLRSASAMDRLPSALMTTAWMRAVQGKPDQTRANLDEAQQLAERGPMRLHLADIHLHRGRLFRDQSELQKARALIEHCGYWRRRQELEDAEEVARSWK